MSLAIINGANILARSAIRRLAPIYKSIRLLDYKPYRPSVYTLCKELKEVNGAIQKIMTTNVPTLEHAIEGSSKILYFTHDYTYLAPDKGQMLQATAEISKKMGIKQTICVCPIEYDHYTEDKITPFEIRQEYERKALELNPEIALLRPNLMFGENSYMIKYLTQGILAGRSIYPHLKSCGKQKYFPIHMNDVVNCIIHALENDQITGLEYTIRGSKSYTFDGILEVLAKHCKKQDYIKSQRGLLAGFIERACIGKTHDKNMMNMVEWHEIEPQNLKNDWNYIEKFVIKESPSFAEYYAEGKVAEEKYYEPSMHKYKCIALDQKR